jgi:hypothetical protein
MMTLHATYGDALIRSHRILLEDLQDLEMARSGLATRLDRTRMHLAEHFRFEEQNGYLASIVEEHPHLDRAVQRLHDEHRELLAELDRLRAEAHSARQLPEGLTDRIARWARKVRRHEQSENILVEDAFNVDLAAWD